MPVSASQTGEPPCPQEQKRLQALARYDLLDTLPEPAFDRLTRLARRLFGTPVVLISLVDEERQWFKSHLGIDLRETPRAASFCTHNIERREVMVVEDAAQDARFGGNALVHDDPPGLRFYAGAPLMTSDGYALGSFCVLDREPRCFGEEDRAHLRDFARLAMEKIEQRRAEAARRASEERHRLLQERLPVGVYRSTPDGRILEANAAMAALLGYDSVEALLQERVPDLYIHAEDRVRHHRRLGREDTAPAEFPLRRADGTVVWVRDYPQAVTRGEAGEIDHFDGVLVDITERKSAEAENEAWRTFYENTLDHIPLEIVVFDPEGRFIYVNKAAVPDEEMRREMIGKTDLDYARWRGRDEQTVRQRYEWILQVLEEKQKKVYEEALTAADGHRQHHRRVAVPALDEDGEVEYVIGYSIDLTDRKRVEEKLIEAKEEAEELARLKSTFLANMSHEIRTPLASILGFAEVLVEETEGKRREFAELIQQGGERLSETLDSVLDLARLEAGGFEMEFETVFVKDVLEEAVALYAPMAEQKGLTFEQDLPEQPLRLHADRAGVGRMVANLLSNAIKFTDEGTITLAARRSGGRVELRVSDTGAGMKEEFREHLFEAFRQESSGLSRRHEGTGLGLAITRRLADVMNADIQVDSRKDAGSTFVLSFPEWREDALASPPQASGGEPLSAIEDREREQLLVVEDNRDTRRLLERVLGAAWTPTLAADPQAAFEAAQETDFDIVVVDIHLGTELDGVDVMKRLRRDARYAGHYERVPFVALTAYAMPEDEERFAEAGFDAYLAKPFVQEDLLSVLRGATAEGAPA